MKVFTFLMLLFGLSKLCLCQTKINIAGKDIIPEIVDDSKFVLYGKWKVIFRTYVGEREKTYEILPLEQLNEDLYKQRKEQGELTYNNYVLFSDSLYIPYSSLLPKLIINPKFKKTYYTIDPNENQSDPRWGYQKLLLINVLCPLFANQNYQTAFTIFVLTKDIIVINYNNSSTFLERVNNKMEENITWKIDTNGFYFTKVMGSTDIGLIIKNHSGFLQVKYDYIKNSDIKYNFIDNKINDDCNNNNTNILFTTRNKSVSYPLEIKIPLKDLTSDIIEINIGTIDQTTQWLVRWKIVK